MELAKVRAMAMSVCVRVFRAQKWLANACLRKEVALRQVFAVFQRRWRRERVWQQACLLAAAAKCKVEAAQAQAAAAKAKAEAVEEAKARADAAKAKAEAAKAKAAAEKESLCCLDGFRRASRHDAKQRMASDLALAALKMARMLRRRKAGCAAAEDTLGGAATVEAVAAAKLRVMRKRRPSTAAGRRGVRARANEARKAAVRQVPLFRAVRRLYVEHAVTTAQRAAEAEQRRVNFEQVKAAAAAAAADKEFQACGGLSGAAKQPDGAPPPDAPPGPPEATSGAAAVIARRGLRRSVSVSGDDADDDGDSARLHRSDRTADGKGRRRGAKLALGATMPAEAQLLPALAQRRNSLVGAASFRDPKNVVAELPMGAVNVASMPARRDYDSDAAHDRAHAAWRKENVQARVIQQRWAAAQEKKVGLINDWMARQGYQPFVEWRLEDAASDGQEGVWQLHLLVDEGVPRVPTITSITEWAYAYSIGKAPKGGSREYRAGPWYGLMGGATQAERLMPEAKERAYGHGAYAAEPPRFTTIEQSLSAMRQWLKRALRDYPTAANPLDSQVVRDVTATLEGDGGRAPVEERLPRALKAEEVRSIIASAHVTVESAGSVERAIEESLNLLYVTKNTVHGDRAHDSYWYNHGDVVACPAGEEGGQSGQSFQRASTKNNKKQRTDKKQLQCCSACLRAGTFGVTAEGKPDADHFCVACLVEHVRSLVKELLGSVPAELPFFADFRCVQDLQAGTTLVMAAANSVADKAGLCVCSVTAEELALGVMYDRTVPFAYDGKQYYPPMRGIWYEVARTGVATRAWASANGVTMHLHKQLLRASRRTDLELRDIDKVSSKSMRRTMATIMTRRGVTSAELVGIGDWSTEAMARRYVERLNLFAAEAKNYSDVGLGSEMTGARERAMRPQKKQAAKARVPHKEKEISDAEKDFREAYSLPCCPRPEGQKNPLVMSEIKKTPDVEKLLKATIWDPVEDVQDQLCAMNCHVSRREIQSYRQPRRTQLKRLAAAGECTMCDAPFAAADDAGYGGSGGDGGEAVIPPTEEEMGSFSSYVKSAKSFVCSWFQSGSGLSNARPPREEPPPDAPPGPPDSEDEELSGSQEEAMAVALSLESTTATRSKLMESQDFRRRQHGSEMRDDFSESQEEAMAIALSLEKSDANRTTLMQGQSHSGDAGPSTPSCRAVSPSDEVTVVTAKGWRVAKRRRMKPGECSQAFSCGKCDKCFHGFFISSDEDEDSSPTVGSAGASTSSGKERHIGDDGGAERTAASSASPIVGASTSSGKERHIGGDGGAERTAASLASPIAGASTSSGKEQCVVGDRGPERGLTPEARAVEAAIAYMKENAGPHAPNAAQERVIREYFKPGPPKQMVVIGPPGTGKSTLFQACVRGVLAMDGVPVLVAEYNPQVHQLNNDLGELARGSQAVRARTRAALFSLPERGQLKAEELVQELTATAQHVLKTGTHKLEDEYALSQAGRMDVCNDVCQEVRGDARPWGGLHDIKFGDPMQGDPITNEEDLDLIAGSDVQPRVTITSEGLWRRLANVDVHVLTERVRFTEPVLIAGHLQIACGPTALGAEAEQIRQLATAKVFDDDTYVHTAVGNNKRAMEIHNEKAWRRAARRGMSEANGGVHHYKDDSALAKLEAREYTPKDLQALRGFGYEEQVFVKGELYLISVKEREPGSTAPMMTVGVGSRGSRRAVTNLEVATLRDFGFDAHGRLSALEMHVKGTAEDELVTLHRATHRFGHVQVDSFPARPYYERFAKLYQGLQFDNFHVDTAGWNPNAWGLLGMAVSRVKSLHGLKLSGVGTAAWLKKKASANWKVILEVSQYMALPPATVAWASACQQVWADAWRREDQRRARVAAMRA